VFNPVNIFRALVLLSGLVSALAMAQFDDPTRPPDFVAAVVSGDAAEQGETWTLTSILVSPQRSVAIINGKALRVGETLAGATVMKIELSGVTLQHNGELINLKLVPIAVKTNVPGKE